MATGKKESYKSVHSRIHKYGPL